MGGTSMNIFTRQRCPAAALLLVVCLAAEGCGRHDQKSDEAPNAQSADLVSQSRFYLDRDALSVQVAHALDGDPDAADRVFMHYTTVDPNDEATLLYWMRIAVENGNAGYMKLYALTLRDSGGDGACRRALFWLRRSAELVPGMKSGNAIVAKEIEESAVCKSPNGGTADASSTDATRSATP
jgi:hypothetical protein